MLPLSHDEVVHGKRSLLDKMPGDEWQKRANYRLLHRLHDGAPGQEADVHGRGIWPVARMARLRRPRVERARASASSAIAGLESRVESCVSRISRAACERAFMGRIPLGRGRTIATKASSRSCASACRMRAVHSSSSPSIARPCRAMAISSAYPQPAAIGKSSTATIRHSAALAIRSSRSRNRGSDGWRDFPARIRVNCRRSAMVVWEAISADG